MQTISLDMYTSLALATVLLIWGKFLSRKIQFFRTYSIPEPVIGGLSFAIIAMVLRQMEILAFEFDTTLQTLAMIVFFTTVGFNANFATLKVGSKKVILFLISAILLVTFQNAVAVGLSKVLGIDLFVGLATGSTPMTGGHGTSIAIGEQLEAIGVRGTQAIAVTAATFGLVAGSMIGGPLANHLIKKYDLVTKKLNSTAHNAFDDLEDEILSAHPLEPNRFVNAAFQIAIAIGVGTLLNPIIAKSGLNFPVYIGPMIAAVFIRNVCETPRFPSTPMEEVDITSSISLQFFLAIALMNLKLWELAGMAGPIVILLSAQVILMLLHARFITFKMMGSNYDAAVLAGGHCGFGMGATPNGMANITSITGKYIPSRMAFFVLPIVGSLFIDLFNISIIQVFINLIS